MSNADELLKLKELLDNNIITQEEFDTKKKELLNSSNVIQSRNENDIYKKYNANIGDNNIKSKKSKKGIIIFLVICAIIGIIGSGASNTNTNNNGDNNSSSQQTEKFTLLSKNGSTDSYGYTTITGEIKNNTNKKYSYVEVTFTLYDESGAQIGTAMDNINNLEANATWKYKAIGLGSGKCATFKCTGITGW